MVTSLAVGRGLAGSLLSSGAARRSLLIYLFDYSSGHRHLREHKDE
jgi:hypothetical protein